MKTTIPALVLVLASIAAGCGGATPAGDAGPDAAPSGPAGSCLVTAAPGGTVPGDWCQDYGAGFTAATAMTSCAAGNIGLLRATYATTPCATANRVGRCTSTRTEEDQTRTSTTSYYAPYPVENARSICSTGVTAGTWMDN